MANEDRLIRASTVKDKLADLEASGGHKYYRQGMNDVLHKFMPQILDDCPTVNAVEVPDKELLRAIKLLIKQYEHSKNSEYVHSPVAHALFHTWRQVEERRTDP